MSLILEALKKSEQQRRLGEVPSFGTPVPLVRRRRSLLPLFVVLILVALGIGWWFSRKPVAPVAEQAPATAAATADTKAGTDAGRPPAPAPRTPAADKPVNLKPVQPRPAPSAQADAKTMPAAPILPMPTTDRPGSVAPLPSMPIAAGAGKPHAEPAKPEPESGPLLPPKPAPASTPATKAPAAVADTKPTPPADTTPKPKPAAAGRAATPPLPLVWELPYSTRKDLPKLDLTMHVYSDVPDDRFVVIEGERHGEGDDLGDGVILREIRPDGMVLDYKGQQFLFPRDGR